MDWVKNFLFYLVIIIHFSQILLADKRRQNCSFDGLMGFGILVILDPTLNVSRI